MAKPDPITNYVLTPHAEFEMARRGITRNLVDEIMAHPEQRIEVRSGRDVLQSVRPGPGGKNYLFRVFADVDRTPAEIVTV